MSKTIFNISLGDMYITPEDAEKLNAAAKQLREGPLLWSPSGVDNVYRSTVILIGIETLIALFRKKKENDT